MKTLLIHFERLGPYHLARIHAAHAFFTAQGWQVIALEVASRDRTYQWREEGGHRDFETITLFPGKEYDSLKPREIRDAVTHAFGQMAPHAAAICGYYSPDACALLSLSRQRGCKAVLMTESTRGDHPRNSLKELFKAWRLRGFDAALCGGIPHRDYLIQLGMSSQKIFTGYNAVDNHFFEAPTSPAQDSVTIPPPLRVLSGKPYYLSSNRFIPRKNLLNLLKAYSLYRSVHPDGWGLILLGDGEERKLLQDFVDTRNIPDVVFPGFEQIDRLPSYYKRAGAFIHVPLTEPWGLVVNEAMASGLPVIVSDTAGCARDLCRHGINGLQVDAQNPEQIAHAMQLIAGDHSLRQRFGTASRAIIKEYSPVQFAQGLWRAVHS